MNLTDLTFTTDWTTSNIPHWRKALAKFTGKPGIRALEIGTWEGRSTKIFLELFLTGTKSKLTTIDRDHSRFDHNRNILEEAYPSKLIAVQTEAFEWLRDYAGPPFQFIYLDGPKDAGDLIDQAVLCWRILADGGVLIFDDYMWPGVAPAPFENPPRHYANPPRVGIDAFMATHYDQFDLVHRGWQVIISKKWPEKK